jgi:hypothetical protein
MAENTDRPIVLNPEAIGDPDQTPIVQLPPGLAASDDPRLSAEANLRDLERLVDPGTLIPTVAALRLIQRRIRRAVEQLSEESRK